MPLSDKSPAFAFPSGKSYFSAYTVEGKARRYINVQSQFNGMMIGQYFHPVFWFLDERQKPISQLSPELGFVDARLFATDRDAHMAGMVAVPENASFVVVHTVPVEGSADVATTSPSTGVFMAGRIPVITRSPGSKIALTRTPTGTLKLRLVDY